MSQQVPFPWPARSATGVGSMPGTDPHEATAVVLGELPNLPFLPELPARGPGADVIGRTAALLVDLPVETTPTGWRLAERRGRDMGRAIGMLEADLDALEAAADGYTGAFKIQLCGLWTLAASLGLTRSIERPVRPGGSGRSGRVTGRGRGRPCGGRTPPRAWGGACRAVRRAALPGVIAGSVPTASGLRRVAPVDAAVAADRMHEVLLAASAPAIVHCCAPDVPWRMIAGSGASAVSFDLALVRRADEDAIGEIAEAGFGIAVGAVPALADPVPEAAGREVAGERPAPRKPRGK